MDEQTQLLHLIAERLDQIGVAYMVSGSVALNLYAQPRMTRDTDVVVALEGKDVDRFVRAFATDFYCDRAMVMEAVVRRDMFNVIHNTWIAKVDFIVRKNSTYRREEFGRRRTIDIAGREVAVVAPEDLLLSKLVWSGGTSDLHLRDVRGLVRHRTLDWEYVERWAATLGVAELVRGVREAAKNEE